MGILKNKRHEHFAQLVANGKTPPQAYVAAGYSEHGAAQSANRLLKNVEIANRVSELQRTIEEPARERAIEKTALERAWVIDQLMENVAMAKQAVPVFDRKGNPTGIYEQNLAAANRALELLGKEVGMFKDQIKIEDERDRMSDEELRERVRRRLAEEGIQIGTVGNTGPIKPVTH